MTDISESDLDWCRKLFGSLKDGGVWGVPRSGLIFRREGDKLVFEKRGGFEDAEGFPGTPEELDTFQRGDFDDIKRHFEAAGIEVVGELEGR